VRVVQEVWCSKGGAAGAAEGTLKCATTRQKSINKTKRILQ